MISDLSISTPITEAKIVSVDTPIDDYLSYKKSDKGFPVMSRSDLCEFSRNPRRWRNGYRDHEETSSTEWGTLVDTLLLQTESFQQRYIIVPKNYPCEPTKKDPRTEKPWNRNATYCKEWEAEQSPKLPLDQEDYDKASLAVGVLKCSPQIHQLLQESRKQVFVTGEYQDEETGMTVPLKGLLDIVPDLGSEFPKSLFDFKTGRSAEPRAWTRAVHDSGYHVQAALYLDLYVAATGEDRCDFRHIIQENFAPFDFSRRFLSEEFVSLGRLLYTRALKQYCRCLDADEWPGYSSLGALVLPDGFESCSPEAWMAA